MAVAPYATLTPNDRRLIQEALDYLRSLRFPLTAYDEDLNQHQAPETYLARSPAGGVPALICPGFSTGTGTERTDYVPGYADCDIYRLRTLANAQNILFKVAGLTQRVYNLNTEPVPGDAFMLITRDKSGDWFIAEVYDVYCPTTDTGTGTGVTPPIPYWYCVLAPEVGSEQMCLELTWDQWTQLRDIGWTMVSGPHDDINECLTECSPEPTGTGTGPATGECGQPTCPPREWEFTMPSLTTGPSALCLDAGGSHVMRWDRNLDGNDWYLSLANFAATGSPVWSMFCLDDTVWLWAGDGSLARYSRAAALFSWTGPNLFFLDGGTCNGLPATLTLIPGNYTTCDRQWYCLQEPPSLVTQSCYHLTEGEFRWYLSQGYSPVLLGSYGPYPYTSQALCLADCEGGAAGTGTGAGEALWYCMRPPPAGADTGTGGCTSDCPDCVQTATAWNATITGVADSDCLSCTNLNGNYTLGVEVTCRWDSVEHLSVCTAGGDKMILYAPSVSVTGGWAIVLSGIVEDSTEIFFKPVGTFDCCGANVFEFDSANSSGPGLDECDFTNALIYLDPDNCACAGVTTGTSPTSGAGDVCLELTAEQLALLAADGWFEVGGPYSSEATCLAACGTPSTGTGTGGPTVDVACCPDPISEDLCLTMVTTGNDCDCLGDITTGWDLIYNAGSGKWVSATSTVCGSDIRFELRCDAAPGDCDGWYLSMYCNSAQLWEISLDRPTYPTCAEHCGPPLNMRFLSAGPISCSACGAGDSVMYGTVTSGTCSISCPGPNSASAGSSVSNPNSTAHPVWSSPGNVTASDDARASCVVPASDFSDYLVATGFGFAIPSGATITSITVTIERRSLAAGTTRDSEVRLTKDGTTSVGGSDAHISTAWPTTEAVDTYDGSVIANPLWATTWTPAEINASTFGVFISVFNLGAADTAEVDHVTIKVCYRE